MYGGTEVDENEKKENEVENINESCTLTLFTQKKKLFKTIIMEAAALML